MPSAGAGHAFTWVKTIKGGKGFPIGMGYHTRGNPELCLLAARGKGVQRLRRDARELIISPRRKHSQKPNEAYDRIDTRSQQDHMSVSGLPTGYIDLDAITANVAALSRHVGTTRMMDRGKRQLSYWAARTR